MENKDVTGMKQERTNQREHPAPASTPKVEKVKKPRQAPIEYKIVSKVERLVREGKGTIAELVEAGVSERHAKIAIKKLTREKVIKQSFVVTE